MRLPILALIACLDPLSLAARDVAGRFDYYVLALSWQPSWCSRTGDARDAPECRKGSGLAFTVHGLWPQYERGWPERCTTAERDPARHESAAMTDIMSSAGLAWYQWQKHGRCSGLSAQDYYTATRKAFEAVTLPQLFDDLGRDLSLPPAVVEEAFLEANPRLHPDGVTMTCRDAALAEVRICLTRDLEPRACAPDTRQDCTRGRVLMEEVR